MCLGALKLIMCTNWIQHATIMVTEICISPTQQHDIRKCEVVCENTQAENDEKGARKTEFELGTSDQESSPLTTEPLLPSLTTPSHINMTKTCFSYEITHNSSCHLHIYYIKICVVNGKLMAIPAKPLSNQATWVHLTRISLYKIR